MSRISNTETRKLLIASKRRQIIDLDVTKYILAGMSDLTIENEISKASCRIESIFTKVKDDKTYCTVILDLEEHWYYFLLDVSTRMNTLLEQYNNKVVK